MRDVRIQKVLAEQGVCSRRAAEQDRKSVV